MSDHDLTPQPCRMCGVICPPAVTLLNSGQAANYCRDDASAVLSQVKTAPEGGPRIDLRITGITAAGETFSSTLVTTTYMPGYRFELAALMRELHSYLAV